MGFSENIAVGGNKFTSVIFLQLGDGLSSFDKNNRVNVSGEKKKNKIKIRISFPGCLFFFLRIQD